MHDREKSDGRVLPVKPLNKAQGRAAEVVDGRRSAKGNAAGETRLGAEPGKAPASELDRVRRIARTDKDARFTVLLITSRSTASARLIGRLSPRPHQGWMG
jgi:RNA-directed DNA polymerase